MVVAEKACDGVLRVVPIRKIENCADVTYGAPIGVVEELPFGLQVANLSRREYDAVLDTVRLAGSQRRRSCLDDARTVIGVNSHDQVAESGLIDIVGDAEEASQRRRHGS